MALYSPNGNESCCDIAVIIPSKITVLLVFIHTRIFLGYLGRKIKSSINFIGPANGQFLLLDVPVRNNGSCDWIFDLMYTTTIMIPCRHIF